ncbi:MAG: hypothetical protein IH960_01505 [Chloroflexi bacterium]|nr:hypothetical protein [Chloroflexota bacterium]
MTPANDAQQLDERAHENRLQISVDDAAAIDGFNAAAEAAFPTVREIDAPGFEQAADINTHPVGLSPRAASDPGENSTRKSLIKKKLARTNLAKKNLAKKSLARHVQRKSTLTERGFGCIALDRPADGVNVGHALRAALGFGARMVILGGADPKINVRKLSTDPGRAYRHVPVLEVDDIFDAMPNDCTPVAVEITDDAVDLVNFVHPERACYIFGPENGSISPEILEKCRLVVKIPTTMSLNLGMTVNIVMYDRLAKSTRKRNA